MMSILLILVVILSVVVLSKWLICIIFLYPIIALAAFGNREADDSLKNFYVFL